MFNITNIEYLLIGISCIILILIFAYYFTKTIVKAFYEVKETYLKNLITKGEIKNGKKQG